MLQDMIQFGTIFLVFFISFYFTLRGEVRSTDTQLRMPFSANGSFGNESNMTTSETGTLNTIKFGYFSIRNTDCTYTGTSCSSFTVVYLQGILQCPLYGTEGDG